MDVFNEFEKENVLKTKIFDLMFLNFALLLLDLD